MNDNSCVIAVVKSPQEYQAYKISPNDTNKLAIIFDPNTSEQSLTVCVEIFEQGGKTPPNRHLFAIEMFFILKGEGIADCDGKIVKITAGDSLLIPSTGIHQITNTGEGKLYALCIMIPNEDFAELIRNGTPVELDQEDLQVLKRLDKI